MLRGLVDFARVTFDHYSSPGESAVTSTSSVSTAAGFSAPSSSTSVLSPARAHREAPGMAPLWAGLAQPQKVKTLSASRLTRFLTALAHAGVAPMAYAPRQFFNGRGERYVASRTYAWGFYGKVRLGVRSDGQEVIIKEWRLQPRKARESYKAYECNPHKPLDRHGWPVVAGPGVSRLENIHEEMRLMNLAKAAVAPLDYFELNGRAYMVAPLMGGDVFDLVNRPPMHNTSGICGIWL